MKLHILWPFAFGLLLLVSMNSCTKTITNTVDSTTVDTLRDTVGSRQAWIRFVSMFPDSLATTVIISKNLTTPSVFAYAVNSVSGSYFPLRSDTSYLFYLSSPTIPGWSDSLAIPILGNTVNTLALFRFGDQTQPQRSIDSEKLTPPPLGYSYVRFINGISDGTADFYLDLDTVGNPLFSSMVPIQDGQISPYVLVKTDRSHTLYLRTPGTTDVLLTQLGNFENGSYYSVRAIGLLSENNARLVIDQE
jgi:hypothetical protein